MNKIEYTKEKLQDIVIHELGMEDPFTLWFCSICDQSNNMDVITSCFNTCLLHIIGDM